MRARLLLSLVPLLTLACHRPPPPTPAVLLPPVALKSLAVKPLAQSGGNYWIPRAATVERGGITGAFIAQDGYARFRMLRLGRERDRQVEVLAGLLGNETLLLGNLDATHDGSPLQGSTHGK